MAISIHLVEDTPENSKIFFMLVCCMLSSGPAILDKITQNNHNILRDGAKFDSIRNGMIFCILSNKKKLLFLSVIVIVTIQT